MVFIFLRVCRTVDSSHQQGNLIHLKADKTSSTTYMEMQFDFQTSYSHDLNRLLENSELTEYALRSLATHLFASGQTDRLLRLLVGNNAYLDATLQRFNNYNLYADALDLALSSFASPKDAYQFVGSLSLRVANQVLRERLSNISDDDLIYMVERGNLQNAINHIKLRSPYGRFNGMLLIAKAIGGWNTVLEDAIQTAESLSDPGMQANSLYELASLVRLHKTNLADNLLFQSLEAAKRIQDHNNRFSLLNKISKTPPLTIALVYDELLEDINHIAQKSIWFQRGEKAQLLTQVVEGLKQINDPRALTVLDLARQSLDEISDNSNSDSSVDQAHSSVVSLTLDLLPDLADASIDKASKVWKATTAMHLSAIASSLLEYGRLDEAVAIMRKVRDDYSLREFVEKLAVKGYFDEALILVRTINNEWLAVSALYRVALYRDTIVEGNARALWVECMDVVQQILQTKGMVEKRELGRMLDVLIEVCLMESRFDEAELIAINVLNEEKRRSIINNAIAPSLGLAGQLESANLKSRESDYDAYLQKLFDSESKTFLPDLEAQLDKMPEFVPVPVKGEVIPRLAPLRSQGKILLEELKNWKVENIDSLMLFMTMQEEFQAAMVNGAVREFLMRVKAETPSPNTLLQGLSHAVKPIMLQTMSSCSLDQTNKQNQLAELRYIEESVLLDKALFRLDALLKLDVQRWIGPAINHILDLFSRCSSIDITRLHRFLGSLMQAENAGVIVLINQIIELAEKSSNIRTLCHLWLAAKSVGTPREKDIFVVLESIRMRTKSEEHLLVLQELFEASIIVNRWYAESLMEDITHTLSLLRSEPNYRRNLKTTADIIDKIDHDRALVLLDEFQHKKIIEAPDMVSGKESISLERLTLISGILARCGSSYSISLFQYVLNRCQNRSDETQILVGLANEMYRSGLHSNVENILNQARQRANTVEVVSLNFSLCRGKLLTEIATAMFNTQNPQFQDTFSEAILATRAIPPEPSVDLSDHDKFQARMSRYQAFFYLLEKLYEVRDARASELISETVAASAQAGFVGIAKTVRFLIKQGVSFSDTDVQKLIGMAKSDAANGEWVLDCLAQLGRFEEAHQLALDFSLEYYQAFHHGFIGVETEKLLDRYRRLQMAEKLPVIFMRAGHPAEAVHAYNKLLGRDSRRLKQKPYSQATRETIKQMVDAPNSIMRLVKSIGLIFTFWMLPLFITLNWLDPLIVEWIRKDEQIRLLRLRITTLFELGKSDEIAKLSNRLLRLTDKIIHRKRRKAKPSEQDDLIRDVFECLVAVQQFQEAEILISWTSNSGFQDELKGLLAVKKIENVPAIEALDTIQKLPASAKSNSLSKILSKLIKQKHLLPWLEAMPVGSLDEMLTFLMQYSSNLEEADRDLTGKVFENFIRIASWIHVEWKSVYQQVAGFQTNETS